MNPLRATTLVFDYGDGTPVERVIVAQGVGQSTFVFNHAFHAQGLFQGVNFYQTFTQMAAIQESGSYTYAITQHVC